MKFTILTIDKLFFNCITRYYDIYITVKPRYNETLAVTWLTLIANFFLILEHVRYGRICSLF